MGAVSILEVGSPVTGSQSRWVIMARTQESKKARTLLDRAAELEFVSIPAGGLYGEATLAFDAGAFHATAVMCRASIEAVFYGFLTRKRGTGSPTRWEFHP